MADEIMTDEEDVGLSIIVGVETKDAQQKLAAWNRELAKAADKAEKYEKLLQIHALAQTKIEAASGIGASARKRDYSAIKNEVERVLTSALASTTTTAARATTPRATMPTESEIAEAAAKTASCEVEFELGDADKKVLDYKGITEWTSKVSKGIKTVEKNLIDFDGKSHSLDTTLTRAKGTLVESGEIRGEVVLSTKEADQVKTRTQEIADGFKTVREYVSLSNGELYLLSEKVSEVKDKLNTVPKGTLVESGEIRGKTVLTTTEADKTRIRTQEIASGFKTIREYIKLSTGELYLMAEKVSEVKNKVESVGSGAKKLPKTFGEFAKGAGDKISKNVEKGFKSLTSGKLFKRIGSIITYRIARSIMSGITNGAKQGFSLLSQDNEAVSSILSQFDEIKTTLQVSFATVLIPIAQALTSALEPISQQFLEFANAMSLANAQAKGESEYYKLSSDSIKEYAKSLRQANQQLSQLDKFATLSGSNTPKLGTMESVSDLLPEDETLSKKYEDYTAFFLNLSATIENAMKKCGNVFEWLGNRMEILIPIAAGVFTAMNPIAGALVGFGLAATSTSFDAQDLGTAMLGLVGGFIGLGIAKQFALNPIRGLAAGAIGGILVGSIASIVNNLGTNGSVNTNTASSASLSSGSFGSNVYSESDLYGGIESATSRSYSNTSMTVKGDVYIDGQKAGRVLESSVYSEMKRVGHMGSK